MITTTVFGSVVFTPSYVWLAREDFAKLVSVRTCYPESAKNDQTRAHFKAYEFVVGDFWACSHFRRRGVTKEGELSSEYVDFADNPRPHGAVEVGIDSFYPVRCRRDHAGLIHLVEIRIV